jgi:hypothetical protein
VVSVPRTLAALAWFAFAAFVLAAVGEIVSIQGVVIDAYLPPLLILVALVGSSVVLLGGMIVIQTVPIFRMTLTGTQTVGWPAFLCIAAWLYVVWRAYTYGDDRRIGGGPAIIRGVAYVTGAFGTRHVSMAEYYRDVAISNASELAFAAAWFLTLAVILQSMLRSAKVTRNA